MAKQKYKMITAVELGTEEIKIVMGYVDEDNIVHVKHVAHCPSLKITKGEITECELVAEQLQTVIEEIEEESGKDICNIFLAVTGGHIQTKNNFAHRKLANTAPKITELTLTDVINEARDINIEESQILIHTIDRFYQIDRQKIVLSPINMVASGIKVGVHGILGDINRINTSYSILRELVDAYVPEPKTTPIVFSPIAASKVALSDEEMLKGTLLIDVGAGVTEYALIKKPGCYHSGQFTIGCEHIANDLAIALKIPIVETKKLIKEMDKYNISSVAQEISQDKTIKIKNKLILVKAIEEIIELRLNELFEIIKNDMQVNNAFQQINAIRICGGGALIPDINKIAQNIFKRQTETAQFYNLGVCPNKYRNPKYTMVIGLIRYGYESLQVQEYGNYTIRTIINTIKNFFKTIKDAIKL